jgi:alkylation response protein AidB-like acyl-CoA dehydrogenase
MPAAAGRGRDPIAASRQVGHCGPIGSAGKEPGRTGVVFALTADHLAVRDMAKAFADERMAPNALRWDEAEHFPVETLREAAALGMAAIYVSEKHGGSGMTRLDAALIFEALSTGCPSVASFLSIHNMVAWVVDRFGSPELKGRYLPRLASMDLIACYCLTEPGAGSDAAALTTRARRDGADYVLDGVKQFISGAGTSDVYVVMARTGGTETPGPRGISAFIVEKGAPGLSFGAHEEKMGWNAQPTAQVVLDGVRVPADAMLGGVDGEGGGFGIAMNGLNGGRINIAACSLGGAQAAYDKAASYVAHREAFGAPLIDEPTIRFTLADMATALETSRLMLWRAAAALDSDDDDKVELCAMAKRYVTDACFDVADKALQLHGGYGYLREYGLEKIVRDLRVHRILEGTNEIMRVVIGRAEAARVRATA